jgi:RNA polymerase sigma-70 factor (ECF subfamily)
LLSQTDAHIVKRAQQGDQAAFTAIYDQYYDAVYTYLYYRVTDTALAEDLTADVFVRLVKYIHTFTPGDKPILAWLYTIAANLLTDHRRKNGRYTWLPLDESLTAGLTDPGGLSQQKWQHNCLLAAVNQLAEEQRQVVLLKFVEKWSNASIAQHLGRTEGAVKSLQHRALESLRRILVEEGMDER